MNLAKSLKPSKNDKIMGQIFARATLCLELIKTKKDQSKLKTHRVLLNKQKLSKRPNPRSKSTTMELQLVKLASLDSKAHTSMETECNLIQINLVAF